MPGGSGEYLGRSPSASYYAPAVQKNIGRRRFLSLSAAGLFSALALPSAVAAAPERDAWYIPPRAIPRRLTDVPVYRTQLDGSRYAGSNCGPATLGMVLGAYGIELDNLELRQLTHTYQGTWPGRGGTALQHMAHVANDFGVPTHGLYAEGEEFRRWDADDVGEQVGRGRFVIPLVRYGLLPGHETSGVRYGHYITVYAAKGDGFLYHDPAYRPIEAGRGLWISRSQLDQAMAPVYPARQALALGA